MTPGDQSRRSHTDMSMLAFGQDSRVDGLKSGNTLLVGDVIAETGGERERDTHTERERDSVRER